MLLSQLGIVYYRIQVQINLAWQSVHLFGETYQSEQYHIKIIFFHSLIPTT